VESVYALMIVRRLGFVGVERRICRASIYLVDKPLWRDLGCAPTMAAGQGTRCRRVFSFAIRPVGDGRVSRRYVDKVGKGRMCSGGLSYIDKALLVGNRRMCRRSFSSVEKALAPAYDHTVDPVLSVDKGVESKYERKSPVEHVLLRPGMYIGSVDKKVVSDFVWDDKKSMLRLNNKLGLIPGLLKLFDEILVNAADNAERSSSMTRIDVTFDKENNLFTVRNDGRGIPVVLHKKENMYVPELVLGHLLTGSNFDDAKVRFTGGRHGYGAKLTNIMSNKFTVVTHDSRHQKSFRMSWANHMEPDGSAIVEPLEAGKTDLTEISFEPDLSLFRGLGGGEFCKTGTVQAIHRRVLDTAGLLAWKNITVTWNGERIKVDSFFDYAKMYLHKEKARNAGHLDLGSGWELVLTDTPTPGNFSQVSFVNSMHTSRGGTHVDAVCGQIVDHISDVVNKRKGFNNVRAPDIKKHIGIFLKSRIPNPSFDSQMKDYLTTPSKAFEDKTKLSVSQIRELSKDTKIIKNIQLAQDSRERSKLEKVIGGSKRKAALLKIPKLEDANFAGTKKSDQCTLILTEGDSAKALAMAGLAVVGRDRYGVFPLRGKLLNVRAMADNAVLANAEIKNLCSILGLNLKLSYEIDEDMKQLRYGRVMIMTDQDYDGSHIKGLIINLFECYWPHLVSRDGFLCEFVTPLIKASRGRETLAFFTMPEYEAWQAQEKRPGWTIKYYKGLGTSTSSEAKDYFSDLGKHTLDFKTNAETDTSDIIDLAFNKKRANDRKDWLTNSLQLQSQNELGFVDHSQDHLNYDDFINKELVLFSQHDLRRSIPSAIDGLKPSQRKVLFAGFKRNLEKEIKVGQLAGYCSEHTAYHHGEASLHSTIINMAQDFVGSNNLPLLIPSGQFGTRLLGGKDAASARYVFTQLQPYTRSLFPKADDELLEYLNDDGITVEPSVFLPIIPIALVNGADGIGTGWSTKVLAYNPLDIVDNVSNLLKDQTLKPMKPYYRGFRGEIKKIARGWVSEGTYTVHSPDRIDITELPIGKWTEDFKTTLGKLLDEEIINGYAEHHTEKNVLFKLKGKNGALEKFERDGKLKRLLQTNLLDSNMHLFDHNGCIQKYENPNEIIEEFFPVRLVAYEKRRINEIMRLQRKILRFKNQIRFSDQLSDGSLVLVKRPKEEIIQALKNRQYATDDEIDLDKIHQQPTTTTFNYLLNQPVYDFSLEKSKLLEERAKETESKCKRLEEKTARDIWQDDLDVLREQIIKQFPELDAIPVPISAPISAPIKKKKKKKKKKTN